jgi:hypothetical protein
MGAASLEGSRMIVRRSFAFLAALALAAPVSAQSTDVQPGGDIPSKFHPVQVPPIPTGGDIPATFNARRASFE